MEFETLKRNRSDIVILEADGDHRAVIVDLKYLKAVYPLPPDIYSVEFRLGEGSIRISEQQFRQLCSILKSREASRRHA